jgi:glycosyltransferase involved in cell wall biosynthesis
MTTKVTTGRASLQEAFLGSRQTMDAIRRILGDIQPRLQVYDTVRMAQYAPDDVAPSQICYLDDLFSERYDRMLKAAARYPDAEISPLGNFAEHVSPRLRALATRRATQLALLRLERRLVRRSEDRAARTFGRCLLVNAGEAAQLERRAGTAPGRIQSVPPLVTVAGSPHRPYRGVPDFVFLGLLSLPHNDDGLQSFLRTVWPLVLAKMPDAHLKVIGRDASPGLLELTAELGDSVTVEGYIPDLGDALDNAAALVNPLRFGSGIKLKVFEALGRSLPVVSTEIGAEGFGSGPGTGILVANEPAETADMLCSVTSVERNAELSAEARAHFVSTYSRQSVFEVYDTAFAL